ncbi:MAG: hypothetical protein AB7G48_09715 [Nitrospiraceae bacterium]
MISRYLASGALLCLVGLVAACSSEGPDAVRAACGADHHCMQDLMFHYRQQAAELNVMADRYAREAEMRAQALGSDSEAARQSQDLARTYALQAQKADQLAHEYQVQVPHNAY